MSKLLSTPNGSPRKKPLPAALAANLWKPGQSGHPGGKGGTYYEMMRLARQLTPQATQILIDIASDPSEEARSRIVAIGMLYDRAWGKPKDYHSARDKEEIRPRFESVTRPSSSARSSGCFVWSRQRRPGPRTAADVVSPHVVSELEVVSRYSADQRKPLPRLRAELRRLRPTVAGSYMAGGPVRLVPGGSTSRSCRARRRRAGIGAAVS
jgi:hypothetical protein